MFSYVDLFNYFNANILLLKHIIKGSYIQAYIIIILNKHYADLMRKHKQFEYCYK